MGFDIGGLSAPLDNRDDFAQMNQNAENNLRYATSINQDSQKRQEAENTARKGFHDYLNTLTDLGTKALPGDRERILDRINELKAPITEGLKASNGNISNYMQAGGYNDLDDLKDKLFN